MKPTCAPAWTVAEPMTTSYRTVAAFFIALLAGPSWAGERVDAPVITAAPTTLAWVGDYRVRDAHGERRMTVVRDATRVEYRVDRLPVRVWRQVADGVELQELHPERGERVTFAPGDLRALDRAPAWGQISSLVDPSLRDRLAAGRDGKVFGEPLQRYRGKDGQDHTIELDWLPTSAMPARYHIDAGAASETIELRGMRRLPADQAFTATATLRETDGADQGD
jgi:hypothetical protein